MPTHRFRFQVLSVLALCAMFSAAQVWAQAPATVAPALPNVQVTTVANAVPATTPLLDEILGASTTPAPRNLSSTCTTNADCPTGKLCCLACGFAGCDTFACFTPMRGHCPLFP